MFIAAPPARVKLSSAAWGAQTSTLTSSLLYDFGHLVNAVVLQVPYFYPLEICRMIENTPPEGYE